jgi:hypothetical protein
MSNGKGSKPRPIKDINQFSRNWDQINWSKPKKIKQIKKAKLQSGHNVI